MKSCTPPSSATLEKDIAELMRCKERKKRNKDWKEIKKRNNTPSTPPKSLKNKYGMQLRGEAIISRIIA